MIDLSDTEFYHIHVLKEKSNVTNKHSEKWLVGNNLFFDAKDAANTNLLSDRVFNPYINIEWERQLLNKLIQKRITSDSSKVKDQIQSEFFMEGLQFKYYQLAREVIFEEVRKSLFADKPSRLNGIWLSDYENIETWLRLMPNKEFPQKIFLVKFSGKAHKADGRWVTNPTLQFEKIYQNAIGYWSGQPQSKQGKPHYEFLGYGSIEIIREHKLE